MSRDVSRFGDNGRGGVTERSPEGDQPIRTDIANEARVYDWFLGGIANFEVDRQQGRLQGQAVGSVERASAACRANRAYLAQVVHYLAAEAGVRQFLDIGSGLPTENNVHQVAQRVASESRVVYVDYDPIVMAHARELLETNSAGATDYFQADFRQPGLILERAAQTFDFSQPVAVLLLSFLHFFGDDDQPSPQDIVGQLLEPLAAGSWLAVSQLTADMDPEPMHALAASAGDDADYVFVMRTRAEIERFFERLQPVKGGVVPMPNWLPDDIPQLQRDCANWYYCGLGVKD